MLTETDARAVTSDSSGQSTRVSCANNGRIWIDLDNSPHVPFFIPIIKELELQGFEIVVTARDAFQVKELVQLHHLRCRCIGKHYGRHAIWKAAGLLVRSLQLLPFAWREHPQLALAHCSRAQAIASKALRIPILWISDYEFAKGLPFLHVDWLMTPELIGPGVVKFVSERWLRYPGIKEDVYIPGFQPDPSIRSDLGVQEDSLLITVRPPAEEAHYHCELSAELFRTAMEFLSAQSGARIVILPRNDKQRERIRQAWPALFESGSALIPPHAVDGLNLIWHSDVVISGGGTMNREAAALGVPVYGIFGGPIGAVDRYLANAGRLVLLRTPDEVRTKIKLVSRDRRRNLDTEEHPALNAVVENILAVCRAEAKSRDATDAHRDSVLLTGTFRHRDREIALGRGPLK
jgi:predicted glycosyltransferase